MSEEVETSGMKSRLVPRWVCGFALLFLCLFLGYFVVAVGVGIQVWMLELPWHLSVGWFHHGWRSTGVLFGGGVSVTAWLLPFIAAVVSLFGFHRLVLWWRRERGLTASWLFSHSLLAGFIVLCGCAAAIALSGAIHETVWLAKGKMIQRNVRVRIVVSSSNARQLGYLVDHREYTTGRYPVSLRELEPMEPLIFWRLVWSETCSGGPKEPFVLIPRYGENASPDDVMILGPWLEEYKKFVVWQTDGTLNAMDGQHFIPTVVSAHSKLSKP